MNVQGFFKRAVVASVLALAMAVYAAPASAAAVIDFGTGAAPASGTYTLLGGGHASGSNIPVGVMIVVSAPANNGVYDTSGTAVSQQVLFCPFPTGNCDTNGSASLDFNTALNTITVTGGIPALGVANQVLLTGTFLGWTADANGLQGAFGPDAKSAALLAVLGLAANTPFAYFGFSLTAQQTGLNTWNIISTDIRNNEVPEPGTLVLLGAGLLGAGRAVRRRFKS
jgi:PEP-CTERM motif-containing protein